MRKIFRILGVVIILLTLSAHELFLKSDSYFVKENSNSQLYLFNGTFDKSENVITRNRIINPIILGPNFKFVPTDNDYFDKGKATYLKFTSGNSGTYLAGISTKPSSIEMKAKEFTEYLEHEGLEDVISDRKRKGISNKSAFEKYSKHVKAILQVGESKTEDYKTVLGYPVEFVPLKNPYNLKIGERMSFRLISHGKPLANQTVHVSSRKSPRVKQGKETSLRTDDKGEVSFSIRNSGHWYIATIHMVETEEGKFDYESNWATLTFEIKAN